MRILFLTARLPYPPNRGDRLRAYNFIKSLSSEHQIHLLSFIAEENEKANIKPLQSFCQDVQVVKQSRLQSVLSVAMNLWRPLPLQALYYHSSRMQEAVNEILAQNEFDLIYIHLFRMAPFVQSVKNIYRIVDLTDVISREIKRSLSYRGFASRLLYTFENPRIQRYESFVASNFEEIWLISEADKQELVKACPAANIQVVNNGVETNMFYPIDLHAREKAVMFLGHMGVPHNIDAATILARQIFPMVKRQIPECECWVVGAEPAQEVVKLSELPGVTVTGFVPDVNDYLNRAAVFCAPLRFAAGIQFKVVQAMAAGRPVVTTSMVNEGLGAKPDEELVLADTPEEMARHVIQLIQDPQAAQQLGQAAHRFVSSKFTWDSALQRVNQIKANEDQTG
jgi:sugar transferase (PEP-CTERM/EpsH1 system associated)